MLQGVAVSTNGCRPRVGPVQGGSIVVKMAGCVRLKAVKGVPRSYRRRRRQVIVVNDVIGSPLDSTTRHSPPSQTRAC